MRSFPTEGSRLSDGYAQKFGFREFCIEGHYFGFRKTGGVPIDGTARELQLDLGGLDDFETQTSTA